MSEFAKHEPCPECGSSDNLARYTDGHAWCFGCGYYEPAPIAERIKTTFDNPPWEPSKKFEWPMAESTNQSVCQALPDDCTNYIPAKCLTWLHKYGILSAEIQDSRFCWSEEKQLLVMPVYSGSSWADPKDRGRLLMWQGRYFGPWEQHPKYLTRGPKEQVVHLLNDRASDTIILTEDLISAIKVGRQFSTMPLWGSTLSLELIVRLSKLTKSLVLWLDDDKYDAAVMYRTRASQFIPNVHVLRTPKDPKDYNDDAIYMYVTNTVLGGK